MSRVALALAAVCTLIPTPLAATDPDAAEIMARVGENQDRAIEQRKEFVYHQISRVRLLKSNGKLLWDETREYDVTPTPTGSESKLMRRYGERHKGRKHQSFDVLDEGEIDGLDPELVDSFHDDLTADGGGRDGFSPNFFPLASKEQQRYQFTLEGEEKYRGRPAYRLRFEPLHKGAFDGAAWKGEVLVDKTEFQPVFVATQLAWKIPLVLRVLFGVSIRQVGFSVSYDRFAEGVWFPVSYGGEFYLKLFHFYKRTITVSMVNQDFRRTTVASNIRFGQPASPTGTPDQADGSGDGEASAESGTSSKQPAQPEDSTEHEELLEPRPLSKP